MRRRIGLLLLPDSGRYSALLCKPVCRVWAELICKAAVSVNTAVSARLSRRCFASPAIARL